MIVSNELPRLNDASGALVSRLIALQMSQSFYGQEDHGLTDKLLVERPGILLWAIEGWRRLRDRGHFVQPDSALELLGDLSELSSPIGAFVRERCMVGPGYRAAVDDLYAAWKEWCEDKGWKQPTTEQVFGRDLLAAVPTLRRVRPRTGDGGERQRAYDGIGLLRGSF
jgi:putative DNA primase/helicase